MGWPQTKAPITVFASAARTATATSDVYQLRGGPGADYTGILLQINVTTQALTPSVTFAIQTSTDGSTWTSLVTSAAATSSGVKALVGAHSSLAGLANVATSTALSGQWRVVATHADTDSQTYTVLAFPLP